MIEVESLSREIALPNEKWKNLLPEEKELFSKFLTLDGLHNAQIEWTILGMGIGTDGAKFVYSFPQIKPEHFYYEANAAMWQEIVEAANMGINPDPVLLVKNLQSHKCFNKMIEEANTTSPTEYMNRMVHFSSESALSASAKHYVEQLIELATRRKIASALYSNFRMVINPKMYPDTSQLLSELVSEIAEVGANTSKGQDCSISVVSNQIIEDFDFPLPATKTGITRLDEAFEGGFYPGKTYCFAARPKIGKTMLMGTMFYNQSILGHPVMYYAFEMGSKELHHRYLARFMGVNSRDFFRRRSDPEFQKMVRESSDFINSLATARYINCPNMSFEEFKRSLVAKVNQHEPKGVYLDYLGKIKSPSYRHNRSEFEEEVADWLHGFAKENDIWIAYACQLNREGNVRGSDGALMGADSLYILEKDEEANTAWLKCMALRYTAKQNIGVSGADPGLRIHSAGPYFFCASDPYPSVSDLERYK